MKLFSRKRKPLQGKILDPLNPHDPDYYIQRHKQGPRSAPAISNGLHTALEAWSAPVGKVLSFEETVPEAVIENPKPYRGAVAKNVQRKMIRESVQNSVELSKMGAKEQAWAQLWSNFTKICYAVGVPVDTNADLRIH